MWDQIYCRFHFRQHFAYSPVGGNVMCVCLYQKSVRKVYRTCLQNSATGFLMPNQRHFLSLLFLFPDTVPVSLGTQLALLKRNLLT